MLKRNQQYKYMVDVVDECGEFLAYEYFSNKKSRDVWAKEMLAAYKEAGRDVAAMFYQLDFASDTGEY